MNKSNKDVRPSAVSSMASRGTVSSEGSTKTDKSKKKDKGQKMTPKQREKLRAMERELKDRVAGLKKEAGILLQEMVAMEEQSALKAEKEAKEHEQRIKILSRVCDNFKTAKSRLVHEHNKVRNEEIWERFIRTDRLPYPEDTQNMHMHLYQWHAQKETEYIRFALPQCDAYFDILSAVDDLIEYPLYDSKETVNNRKEARDSWRKEFFYKIDKATFNMITDLNGRFTFPEENNQEVIYRHEESTPNIAFALYAWCHKEVQFARLSPKVMMRTMRAEFVLPAAYRKKSFVLRALHIKADFFSCLSPSSEMPEGLGMEPDLSREVIRCFEVKKEIKASVAEREREKVRAVQQKLLEAKEAVASAEKNYEVFSTKNPIPKSRPSTASTTDPIVQDQEVVRKKKAPGKELTLKLEPVSPDASSKRGGRGILDDSDRGSSHRSVMLSAGTQKALDSISIKSGMRKRGQDKLKRTRQWTMDEEELGGNMFYTPSMLSISHYRPKLETAVASELCFENEDDEDDDVDDYGSIRASREGSEGSFDSLDFMFGEVEDNGMDCVSIKDLVRSTVVVKREAKRIASKTSIEYKREKGRKRGKSLLLMKKLVPDDPEELQSASDIFESREEERQEKYMNSLAVSQVPGQFNLRSHCSVGGIYVLNLFLHESQPRQLHNCTTQIFEGGRSLKTDHYEYKYIPPKALPEISPDMPLPTDPGLQHMLFVKVPLPQTVIFFEQPQVAVWDEEKNVWTRQYIQNFNFDSKLNFVTFYLEKVSSFSFFVRKYILLPLIKWQMKPRYDNNGISLSIWSQQVQMEFTVLNFQVCLSSIDGVSKPLIEDLLENYMNLHQLIKVMKERGLNVFPDADAFLYINDSTAKDVVLEDHTYMAMALFSDGLEFTSSLFNSDASRRKLFFQVRQSLAYDVKIRHKTAMVTGTAAQLYRCCDEDGSFDENKLENLTFCPDAYSLLDKEFSPTLTQQTIFNPVQVVTIYDLLSRVKVLSYCGTSRKETTTSSSEASKKGKGKWKKPVKSRAKSTIFPEKISSRSSNSSLMLLKSLGTEEGAK